MNFSSPHALQAFWNIAAAPVQASALELALSHNLFDHLQTEKSVDEIADVLDMKTGPVSVWFDLLWSMSLLFRDEPEQTRPEARKYACTDLARRYLVSSSPEDCRMALNYRLRVLRHAGTQFEDFLRFGRSDRIMQGGEATQTNWATAAEQQISQEQRAVSVPSILKRMQLASSLPAKGRFLDLGGGPGHIGIAFARHLPQWTGTVCDLPAIAAVAKTTIANAGLADRISVQSADLEVDEIGSGYDLIWCSCVLHFLRDPRATLQKMFAALNSNGRLYIAHAEVPRDAGVASRVLPFYASMMLRGRFIPAQDQMRRLLADAGFTQIQSLGEIAFPMTPVWLYKGTKP